MLELMRRIGFPPFKRTRRKASAVRMARRLCINEPLEAKVLLAADLSGMPIEAFSIFSALSRGGDALMSQAGMGSSTGTETPAATAPIVTDTATIEAVDEIVAEEIAATESNDPVAAMPVLESGGELSAISFEQAEGEAGDVEITIGDGVLVIYNSDTGFIRATSDSLQITTLEIVSESGIFTGEPALGLGGTFDIDSDTKLFKLDPEGFTSLNFGSVARRGLTPTFLQNDLTISGSVAPSGGLSNKEIRVEVRPTDASGVLLQEINVGDEFYLTARVEDTRSESLLTDGNQGVFAAYFDVSWNGDLASPIGTPEFSDDFTTATSGTVNSDNLDEVGAASSGITPTTTAPMELFRQKMVATGEGTLTFTLDTAEGVGHDFLNFGSQAPIEISRVTLDDSSSAVISDTPTAPDLVAFAKALTDLGVKFYGAGWCPHCTEQKELFEDGQNYLPFIEVTNPDRTPNEIATENNIQSYPTWVFPDGTRLTEVQTLDAIAAAAGISIPESNKPTLIGLEDIDMFGGSPYHVPLDGYDPNGGALTYEVTVTGDDGITAEVLSGNRSLLFDVAGYGKMVFELFDDEAPRATNQIAGLADEGFYDGVIFHRILDDFVIQGGDPDGTGFGGSDLDDFDDQFDFDLQHNRTGILSMAKSFDDTNNSQFFITEGTARHLDFNHTIFGQLIEGESNRENISEVPVDDDGFPDRDVTIESASVFNDIENGLLRVSAPHGFTGSATITVTVSDGQNHSYTESFDVTVAEDEVNNRPFLLDFPEPTVQQGETFEMQLEAVDLEGDEIWYGSFANNDDELDVEVVIETGKVTITPKDGFAGKSEVTASVYPPDSFPDQPGDKFDVQIFEVSVPPLAPSVTLLSSSDTGASDSDGITNAASLEFEVTGLHADAEVELLADGTVIETVTATDTTMTISSENVPEGTSVITVRQSVEEVPSEVSSDLTITVDRTAPADITSSAPTQAFLSTEYTYDVEHADEGSGDLAYSFNAAPTGATIDASTGVIEWTPTADQAGSQSFIVAATDIAGNESTQSFTVTVTSQELMRVRLQIVDSDGNVISAIPTGEEFSLQVYVEDIRVDAGELRGVFAAYVDINYASDLVAVDGAITYGSDFSNGQLGDLSTAGLIDDAGATSGDSTPLGAGEFLLMSIPMEAIGGGQANFTGDLADEMPLADTLLNGTSNRLADSQVTFEGTSLEIVNMTFAVNDSIQAMEDSSDVLIRVLDNDIRIPSDTTLTIVSLGSAANGTVSLTDNDTAVSYTPNADFVGTDTFTYTLEDGEGEQSTGTVTVNVVNVNDDPTASDDTVTTTEDATNVTFDVLANDSSAPDTGETLTIDSVTPVANGTISVSSDGSQLIYTPSANFNGTETVQYTISDGNGGTASATLTINVTEVNDIPVAGNDTRSMSEDTPITINVADLLGNDSAGNSETDQTLTLTSVGGATNGSVSLNGNVVTFTPTADFFGTASFTYTITDDGTTNGASDPQSATGTVTLNISNVNDDPVAIDDVAIAQFGAGSITINVLSNDTTGPDVNETLTVTTVGTPSAGGTVEIGNNGQLIYTPPSDFSGEDTFSYTISDDSGATATATVTVSVANFVPGGLTGYTFIDSNRDGVRSTGEMALSGVSVILQGTTTAGETLSRSVRSDATGYYSFQDLSPGTYTITQVQPGFTLDGAAHVSGTANATSAANTFTVELDAAGTEGVTFNFTEQSLEPRFSIWEALASSGKAGMYSSINADAGQQWSQLESGWQDVNITDIRFNNSRTAVTLTIVEDGITKTTTIPTSDTSRIQVIGQTGNDYLVRLRGDRSDFNFS